MALDVSIWSAFVVAALVIVASIFYTLMKGKGGEQDG